MTADNQTTGSKDGTFDQALHRVDYLAPYRGPAQRIEADSLIDTAGRQQTQSLDGDWHFAIDPYDSCLRQRWFEERYTDGTGRPIPVDFSFADWPTVPVPSCWNVLKPEWLWYEGSAVYFREFSAQGPNQPTGQGRRAFLRFGAAAHTAYLFLNGEYLGYHEGASTPFVVEVTDKLTAVNRLVVVVNNSRRADRVPTDNTDWFNYGGLHRDVELVYTPADFIRTASVSLVPDSTYSHIAVSLDIASAGTLSSSQPGPTAPSQAHLDIVGLLTADIPVDPLTRHGDIVLDAEPELWSPERPRLYRVEISYGADRWIDPAIGFRQIRVNGRDIELNGQPIFLKGISQHEESQARGRTLSEAEIRQNLNLVKELGGNYLRLAHYPHNELTARLADQLGLLLWEEIPVYWAILFDSPAVLADAENQLRELLARDRNRASVIIWSVGNENPDTGPRFAFMSHLVDVAHDSDPTRLVSAACLTTSSAAGPVIADRLADCLDIIGINEYYGWYSPDFEELPRLFANSKPDKPVIVTEFGADAVPGRRGGPDELFTEDKQLAVYERQIATLSAIPYIKGVTPWILYDFRCPRRTAASEGYYNQKGLLSADKTHRKLAFYALQDWYTHRG